MTTVPKRIKKPQPLGYGDGSITLRKSTGTYIVRVRANGTYKQIGSSPDPDRARAILERYNADLDAGLNPVGRDWLTVDWLDEWLTSKTPHYDHKGKRIKGVEPTTFEKYEVQIRRHIAAYVGPGKLLAPRLVDLDAGQAQRWFDRLVRSGLGSDTLNEALMRFSSAMEMAVDYDLIARNPCRRIQRVEPADRSHVKPSELDLVRLIRAIAGDPLEALPWLALGGGFRRGECAALEWQDVVIFNPDHAIIRLHQRRNRLGRRTQQRLDLPGDLKRERLKSQPERNVDVGSSVVRILEARWQHQLADRILAGSKWQGTTSDSPSGYVFTTPLGKALTVRAMDKTLERIRGQAGLDLERFHALRRLFATLLSKTGATDKTIMELGGWSDLKMARYYEDPLASQKRDAAQGVDAEIRRIIGGT